MNDELQSLYDERREAQIACNIARSAWEKAKRALLIAEKRYERQALWLRRDELTRELDELQNQVEKITLSGDLD